MRSINFDTHAVKWSSIDIIFVNNYRTEQNKRKSFWMFGSCSLSLPESVDSLFLFAHIFIAFSVVLIRYKRIQFCAHLLSFALVWCVSVYMCVYVWVKKRECTVKWYGVCEQWIRCAVTLAFHSDVSIWQALHMRSNHDNHTLGYRCEWAQLPIHMHAHTHTHTHSEQSMLSEFWIHDSVLCLLCYGRCFDSNLYWIKIQRWFVFNMRQFKCEPFRFVVCVELISFHCE